MIFPSLTETLVLPLAGDEVERRVGEGIENKRFLGVIEGTRFRLSPYVIRPPQFQPMIRGRIESSSRGCLVFLRYELMPATRLLLGFVSVGLVVGTGILAIQNSNLLYLVVSLVAIITMRAVALTNIRLHRDPVRKHLLEILS